MKKNAFSWLEAWLHAITH